MKNLKINDISGHDWNEEISVSFNLKNQPGDFRIWFDANEQQYKIQFYNCNKKIAAKILNQLILESKEVL